ncbi:MAG: hypothetical protein V3V47_04305 [Desulfobacteria bacterium]
MAKKKINKSKSTRKKKPAKKDTKALAKKELTEDEQKRLDKYHKRRKNKPAKFRVSHNSSAERPEIIPVNMEDPLGPAKMTEALGTPDSDLQRSLLNQVILTFMGAASSNGQNQERTVELCNNALAILNGIQPQDELEGMLAVQMIGVHNMAMETMRRAMLANQNSNAKQANVNQATKMLRTFAAQMEALKKYRTGGQQKMIVEHVHVNEGGQAIVGTVNQGGGGNKKNNE